MQKKYATGRPDQKDLNENLAATQGLAHMIVECNRLFEVEEPVDEMMQELEGWVKYLHPPTLCLYSLSVLPHAFMHPTRSLMRWLLSRVIHTWRRTCTRPPLASCASSLKMTTERTRPIWTRGFRTFLKRRGKSPNTGYPAAALITQSSTTRRLVFFL